MELYARAARRFGWTFVDRSVLRYRTGSASLMGGAAGAAGLAAAYRRMHERYRQERGALDFYALKIASRAEGMLRSC